MRSLQALSFIKKFIIAAWHCQGTLAQLCDSHSRLLVESRAGVGRQERISSRVAQGRYCRACHSSKQWHSGRSPLGIVDFAADSRAGADSDSNKPFMKAAGKQKQRHPVIASSCWTNLTSSGCSLAPAFPNNHFSWFIPTQLLPSLN